MTVTERVAYIRGLMEGLGIDDTTKEGKVLKAMIEVIDDLALNVADVEDEIGEIYEHVDAIDEDLGLLEDDFYDDGDDDDDDDDDECSCCDDDEDYDDGDLYEVVCPSCGDAICINESIVEDGSIDCPNCGEKLEFDMDDCCCGDESCEAGCDCGGKE